mgnify:CR=1 FL=1
MPPEYGEPAIAACAKGGTTAFFSGIDPGWATTDLTSLRAVWAGSSTLPATLVDAFHARGLPLCNVYGATETGPFSIALGPDRARSHAGGCGTP